MNQDLERLLINIENLNENDKNILKSMLIGYYSIDTSDEYMAIYNKLNTNQLKLMLELVGVERISNEFISKINDKESLFVIPYNRQSSIYYNNVFSDEKAARIGIDNEKIYKNFKFLYEINSIISVLKSDELKRAFINNCLLYNKNIIYEDLFSYRQPYFSKYISEEQIINMMKNENDSDTILRIFRCLKDETKIEVYNSEWFRNKVDFSKFSNKTYIFEMLPEKFVEELLKDENDFGLSLSCYRDTKKKVFLKNILDITINNNLSNKESEELVRIFFGINNDILNSIGDYQEKIYTILNSIDDKIYINLYLEKYRGERSNNEPNIIKNIMYNKAKSIIENNDIKIEKISSDIIKNNDIKILELIKDKLSKEDLLLLSIRNEYINAYVMKLLEKDPNYFKNVNIENINKFPIFLQTNEINNDNIRNPFMTKGRMENQAKIEKSNILKKYLQISKYLSEEQLKIYFIPTYISEFPEIKSLYIEKIKSNPNLLNSFGDLKGFEENDINNILERIDIKKILYLLAGSKFRSDQELTAIIINNIDKRMGELVEFINSDIESIPPPVKANIFATLPKEKTIKLVNMINNYSFLSDTMLEVNVEIYEIILDRLARLYNNDVEVGMNNSAPFFIDNKQAIKFYNKLSLDVVIHMLCDECRHFDLKSERSQRYVNYVTEVIDKDINVLFNINIISKIDELLNYLPKDYQDKIINYIDKKYELLKGKYPEISNYISTYTDKANYIMGVENNLINDSTYKYVLELLDKNSSLFSNMDFRLLNPDIMKMGKYFIDKTSRYPIMSSKLIKIYEQDIDKYNLIVRLSQKIRKEDNDSTYDQKIELIINYLLQNNINISENIDNRILYNVESYILEQVINKDNSYQTLNINTYMEEKNNTLDREISACNDLDKLKQLIYQRYLGLSKKAVEDFLFSYAYNWNSVEKLCSTDLPTIYIEMINSIRNTSDINELKKLANDTIQCSISDFLTVKSVMINTYSKSISQDIQKVCNGITQRVKIAGREVEVEELSNNFGIFVHSTDAYGSMPLINDDYYESWNYNPNTKNHGICTSYITNSSYGTANVKNKGIMLGFTNVDENSIPTMAPYDLGTLNDGYTIKSRQKPFYGRLKNITDCTRHTHNETSLERRVFDSEGNSYLRQPDCIIIFEDMPDSIKENSLKAYEDFKKQGIDITIKYIDRVKNAQNEAKKLETLINQYEKCYDLRLLPSILNIYESNICSCDFLGVGKNESMNLFDQHELFKTEKMKNLLSNTVKYISSIEDINIRYNMINYFIAILNSEKFKFDMIKDFNKNRRHTFELYSEELKIGINELLNSNPELNNNKRL